MPKKSNKKGKGSSPAPNSKNPSNPGRSAAPVVDSPSDKPKPESSPNQSKSDKQVINKLGGWIAAIAGIVGIWWTVHSCNLERPSITVVEVGGAPLQDRVPFVPAVVILNAGKSATDVKLQGSWRLVAKDTSIEPEKIVETRPTKDLGILQPGTKRNIDPCDPIPMNIIRMRELSSGDFVLYMFGKLTYKDSWGKGHTTLFEVRMVRTEPVAFERYGTYNKED